MDNILRGQMGMVAGVPVYQDDRFVVWKQTKFARSRKKRIVKKFRKLYSSFEADPALYRMGTGMNMRFIGHPETVRLLCEEIDRRNKAEKERLLLQGSGPGGWDVYHRGVTRPGGIFGGFVPPY